jgi:hypothetical protein
MQPIEGPRSEPKCPMTAICDNLKRVAGQWRLALIVLGFLLTVLWIGTLIGITLYFLMN